MKLSYWEKSVFFNGIDVGIIGSGIVGLNAAIEVKKTHPKKRVVVFERGFLPSGASTKNAGFACFGSISELLDDLETMSADQMLQVVEMRWKGLQALRSLLGDENIGYKPWGGVEVFLEKEKESYTNCKEQIDTFNKMLAPIVGKPITYELTENIYGFGQTHGCINNRHEGQINTGQMMKALIQKATSVGVEIINGINVQQINSSNGKVSLVIEDDIVIDINQLIVCNNAFVKQFYPSLDTKAVRNQVLITTPINGLKIQGTFHNNKGYNYFRNIGNRILLGGGRDLALEEETTADFGETNKIQSYLKDYLSNIILPNTPFEIEQTWSGILGVGHQKAPIIEKINDQIVVAVRLGGMGIAIGTEVGRKAGQKLFE